MKKIQYWLELFFVLIEEWFEWLCPSDYGLRVVSKLRSGSYPDYLRRIFTQHVDRRSKPISHHMDEVVLWLLSRTKFLPLFVFVTVTMMYVSVWCGWLFVDGHKEALILPSIYVVVLSLINLCLWKPILKRLGTYNESVECILSKTKDKKFPDEGHFLQEFACWLIREQVLHVLILERIPAEVEAKQAREELAKIYNAVKGIGLNVQGGYKIYFQFVRDQQREKIEAVVSRVKYLIHLATLAFQEEEHETEPGSFKKAVGDFEEALRLAKENEITIAVLQDKGWYLRRAAKVLSEIRRTPRPEAVTAT